MRRAIFLDRDGVINKEKNYLYKIDDFEFIEGVFEACKKFQENDYLIIVITNQAGIARGLYTERDFLLLTQWMRKRFAKMGVKVDAVYYCPHHPDFTGNCDCRKPKPGMLIKAKNDFNIDMTASFLVGDKESDIEAGINVGINKNILVKTGCVINEKKTRASIILNNMNSVADMYL